MTSPAPAKERIIQEYVPGKQITLAHLIANPNRELYRKLGLNEAASAIGILTLTPSEAAINRLNPQHRRTFIGSAPDRNNSR